MLRQVPHSACGLAETRRILTAFQSSLVSAVLTYKKECPLAEVRSFVNGECGRDGRAEPAGRALATTSPQKKDITTIIAEQQLMDIQIEKKKADDSTADTFNQYAKVQGIISRSILLSFPIS